MARGMKLIVTISLLLIACVARAQNQIDTTEIRLLDKAYLKGLDLITLNAQDTGNTKKSIDEFKKFEKKIVRKIYVRQIGFEKSVYDSGATVKKAVTKLANALHETTHENILRNHVFIRAGEPLNPYLFADNERYLRDRNFLLDSRLVVIPVGTDNDSVDVMLVTRDVFSLGARIGGSVSAPSFGVFDKNIMGRAQLLDVSWLINPDRNPWVGYSIKYGKSSLWGSLVDAEISFTQLNKGISYGDENEYATYVRFNRPLVSSFSRFAGGLEISRNWSVNNFKKPDTIFNSYSYKVLDVWAGYNLGIRKNFNRQFRYFLAVRNFSGGYQQSDEELEDPTAIPNSSTIQAFLGEVTVYKQQFYKTRYIYGFGRTEDIPYGFSMAAMGAYVDLYNLRRPYAALKFAYSLPSNNGNFLFLDLKGGGFYRDSAFEDIIINAQVNYLTQAYTIGDSKLRALVTIGNVRLINNQVNELITANRVDLQRVSLSMPAGQNKTTLNAEVVLYTKFEILGIRFAPIAGASYVLMNCNTCINRQVNAAIIYAGFRARNENLIFGTIEVKAAYGTSTFSPGGKLSLQFRQNLRVKSSYNYIRPPMLVKY